MTNIQTNQTTIAAPAANENKQNDIAQTAQTAQVQHSGISTPMIPDEVYNNLPDFLKRACEVFEGRDRDVFFTAALTS
ncbi:MAG: hypothetical protein JNM41_13535, partial [Flavipsychrobacter sp.]|nr:hypothetical protein [Flavipsychrobacter sp.]